MMACHDTHAHPLLQDEYTHATGAGAPCSQHLTSTLYFRIKVMYLCIAKRKAYSEHIRKWD